VRDLIESGKPPVQLLHLQQQYEQAAHSAEQVSETEERSLLLLQLLKDCFQLNPELRPTAEVGKCFSIVLCTRLPLPCMIHAVVRSFGRV
jgi:hypothetical protein